MNLEKLRSSILAIFISCLLAQIIFIAIPYMQGDMYSKDLIVILAKLLSIYAIHFAVIIGGIFGPDDGVNKEVPRLQMVIALILVVVWNLLFLWRSAAFFFSRDDMVKDLLAYLDNISAASSFLVAGVLVWVFNKR